MSAIIEEEVSQDHSLLGTLHMLSHDALMLRHRARHGSPLAQTASKIHELAYSGMAQIDYHPNSTISHSRSGTLASKLNEIESLLTKLKADEQDFHEIGKIRDHLARAFTLAVGRQQPLLSK